MGYNDNDLPRTKIAMRGKMVVAWLAEATPPILWRFVASGVSVGFSLRHAEGKVELLQYDGGLHPQVIAKFSSEASAERALSRLSRTLLAYKSPWKRALKWSAVIFLFLVLIIGLNVLATLEKEALMRKLQATMGAARAPGTAAQPQLLLPGMTPPGSSAAPANSTPMGSPVDVDKLYK